MEPILVLGAFVVGLSIMPLLRKADRYRQRVLSRYEWRVVVRPFDHPRGLSERDQAKEMGFCLECDQGHTYTADCWWRSRWSQKDASW